LRSPPEDTPNLSTTSSSPSSLLAGRPHDVASFPIGRPSGVNTPPDKTLSSSNHTLQNLVQCEWTSRFEPGLRVWKRAQGIRAHLELSTFGVERTWTWSGP
jgi:hypothetical protein